MMHLRIGSVVLALCLSAAPLLATQGEYEIGPGDVLHILVLGQEAMSGDLTVDTDGMIAFPILGKIKASAMTEKELERKLTTLLADGYLKQPEVSVAVAEYHSQRVYVTGEVQKPGVYALKADRSLLALMAEVGGLTANAGDIIVVVRPPRRLPLVREPGEALPEVQSPEGVALGATPEEPEATPEETGGETGNPTTSEPEPTMGDAAVPAPSTPPPGSERFTVRLDDLRSGRPDANIPLQAGDTVNVPPAAQVFVTGQVGRPGAYRLHPGASLLEVLTLAGGVTARGSSGRVKVIRTINGEKREIKLKSSDAVEPGDTIIVPERFF